ncbi:hypothetical protein ACP49_12795 [Clostridium botulinum]|uniref:hypothetical protein n=1 Tax=Clostridium botulinum TaxID=1491 RepID=UPI0005820FE3|nr:hypothetical protein [Clostridium botulinum]NFK34991.1 hypothetical protein [Clostridium botulinum H04402 065]APQ97161.1 hypothetical protein RSJ3_1629 [Clostridium botulinum]AWB30866.1 hypothetical protein DBN47_11555 [Clostridium botulinum]KEI76311.1 hypothetical protein N486_11295 [Clostridium botulinum B2 128]KOM97905.1 hypothetical protein ACP53_07685 [Clostridium botulinum]
MNKYSNRRRSHIHIIKQYNSKTNEYTGTRLIVFIKGKKKYIQDIDNFIVHKYQNPKDKKPNTSTWNIVNSNIEKLIKKEMINFSEDRKLKMYHILYESIELNLKDYCLQVLKEENIDLSKVEIKL